MFTFVGMVKCGVYWVRYVECWLCAVVGRFVQGIDTMGVRVHARRMRRLVFGYGMACVNVWDFQS